MKMLIVSARKVKNGDNPLAFGKWSVLDLPRQSHAREHQKRGPFVKSGRAPYGEGALLLIPKMSRESFLKSRVTDRPDIQIITEGSAPCLQ